MNLKFSQKFLTSSFLKAINEKEQKRQIRSFKSNIWLSLLISYVLQLIFSPVANADGRVYVNLDASDNEFPEFEEFFYGNNINDSKEIFYRKNIPDDDVLEINLPYFYTTDMSAKWSVVNGTLKGSTYVDTLDVLPEDFPIIGPNNGGAFLTLDWSDEISLEWNKDIPEPTLPSNSLNFTFGLSGTLYANIKDSEFKGGDVATTSAKFGFSAGPFGSKTLLDETWTFNYFSKPFVGIYDEINENVTYTLELPNSESSISSILYSYQLSLYSGASSDATSSTDFFNTVTLDSITFADGSTPESYGWDIVFESGITSPNVTQSVPEPLTILGTATALGFGAFFKRKNTNKQEVE